MQNTWKITETLANGYSSESTRRELSNEYQHDSAFMVSTNFCVFVLWTKVASAMEGLMVVRKSELPLVITGELGYDGLNGTRKIGMHRTGTKHIVCHMQRSVVQWSVISKFTCSNILTCRKEDLSYLLFAAYFDSGIRNIYR